jgi:hypothetical protein
MNNEIEAVVKNCSTKKSPGTARFIAEFYQTFRKKTEHQCSSNYFKKYKGNEYYQTYSKSQYYPNTR